METLLEVFISMRLRLSIATIVSVLFVDQALKLWIKLSKPLGESVSVIGDIFYLHFIENPGMAFGLEFGGEAGKLALSLFRIVAIIGIGWYLRRIIKEGVPSGLIVAASLIFAGAFGNIIDSAFYGLIFDKGSVWNGHYYESYLGISELTNLGNGYTGFLKGNVVDMLYFPLLEGNFPDWFPIWGGEHFLFFRPVFNIADASITVGVLMIILWQKRYFRKSLLAEESEKEIDQEGLSTQSP